MQKNKYFEIRNLAWELLIECGINELPIDLDKIAKKKNWRIVSETEYGEPIKNEIELRRITAHDEELFFIVYKNTDNKQRLRFGIAHEMGHILLEHLGLTESELEKEAHMFAARVLMPVILLEKLKIRSPEEISKLCDVSLQSATHRYKRLQELKHRRKFLTSPLEKQVLDQFTNYITKKKQS